MTRSAIPGAIAVPALLLVLGCAGLEPYRGPVTMLDPAVCSPDGDFTLTSTNPYWPMDVGDRWILEGGSERVAITVLDETEVVAGVTTRVVEEREWEDGELTEVSRNFFAQAADGTVCYFGEDVEEYEDGRLVSHGGAWRADAPGSRPGIIMPSAPEIGMKFPMEIAPGGAEDQGLIVASGEAVAVPAGTFTETIRVREIDPLGDEEEDKLFAAGVGILVDEDLKLVSY